MTTNNLAEKSPTTEPSPSKVKFNDKAILQKSMASFLLLNNCTLISVKKDLKDKKRCIFFFEENPKLYECMAQYPKYKEELNNVARSIKLGEPK